MRSALHSPEDLERVLMTGRQANSSTSVVDGEVSTRWCHQRPLRSIGGVVQGTVAKVARRGTFAKRKAWYGLGGN